jgi:hypothetical protein
MFLNSAIYDRGDQKADALQEDNAVRDLARQVDV